MSEKKLFALDNNFNINISKPTTQMSHVYWIPVEGVSIRVDKLPNRFHRFMVRLFFGWTYEIKTTDVKQMLYG